MITNHETNKDEKKLLCYKMMSGEKKFQTNQSINQSIKHPHTHTRNTHTRTHTNIYNIIYKKFNKKKLERERDGAKKKNRKRK